MPNGRLSKSTDGTPLQPSQNLYEYMREDFVALLDGLVDSSVEHKIIMGIFDQAAVRAMIRYSRDLGIDIT